MAHKQLSAGDYVESRCTRCRTVTNHTIIAMVGDTPARVRCNTCASDHKYYPVRPAAPAKTAKTGGERAKPVGEPRSTSRSSAGADQEQWLRWSQEGVADQAIPYSMERAYAFRQAVNHPLFGLGMVTAVLPPNKVEILFAGGKKLLRCKT